MDFEKIESTIESADISFNVCSVSRMPGGQLLIGTSGDYLVSKEDAASLGAYLIEYSTTITEGAPEAFNEWLRSKRSMEPLIRMSSLPPKGKKKTFIYVMCNNRNGLFKIGKSKDVRFREKTLQSEEPEVELLYSCEAMPDLEMELHERFASKRVRGEWFKLNADDLNNIKAIFEKGGSQ